MSTEPQSTYTPRRLAEPAPVSRGRRAAVETPVEPKPVRAGRRAAAPVEAVTKEIYIAKRAVAPADVRIIPGEQVAEVVDIERARRAASVSPEPAHPEPARPVASKVAPANRTQRAAVSVHHQGINAQKAAMMAVVACAGLAIPTFTTIPGNADEKYTPSLIPAQDFSEHTQLPEQLEADAMAPLTAAIKVAETQPSIQTEKSQGASGNRSAFDIATEDVIVYPLMEGTFVHTSPFGPRIMPTTGGFDNHTGHDFAAPVGTPIHSVADGEVIQTSVDAITGYNIVIKHVVKGETFYSHYYHMYKDGVFVQVGDRVTAGQKIASVGNAGNSTGAHLHLEIHNDQLQPIDPIPFLADRHALTLDKLGIRG